MLWGVEVVHHKNNLLCIGILLVEEPFHLFRPINAAAMLLDISVSPSSLGFREQKDAACPVPDVFVVLVCPC